MAPSIVGQSRAILPSSKSHCLFFIVAQNNEYASLRETEYLQTLRDSVTNSPKSGTYYLYSPCKMGGLPVLDTLLLLEVERVGVHELEDIIDKVRLKLGPSVLETVLEALRPQL